MVIDLDQVDRIVETVCMPMPMTHPLVRGIGFDERRPIVCVGLSGKTTDLAPRTITAVLLAGGAAVTWALCADQIHGVVPLVAQSTTTDERLPRWFSRVRSQDGRILAHLDPAKMALDIGGAP